jgi:hypothetical protein
MQERMNRLDILLGEIKRASEDLNLSADPRAAIVFLDRLARVEAFSEWDLSYARSGTVEIIQLAQQIREKTRGWLADLASDGIDFNDIYAQIKAVNDEGWYASRTMHSVLLLANIHPWLNEQEALTARALVEFTISSTEAYPARWVDAQEILMKREECERTERDNYNILVGDLVDTYSTTLFNCLYLALEQAP